LLYINPENILCPSVNQDNVLCTIGVFSENFRLFLEEILSKEHSCFYLFISHEDKLLEKDSKQGSSESKPV